jgi:Zn-dependent protease
MNQGLPFFGRLSAALERSWRVGRVAGVEVRVRVTTLLLPLWALWRAASAPVGGGFLLAYLLGYVVVLYALVLVHEFGHIFAARRFGVPSRLVTLSPLGGLAHLESPAPSPRAEIAIALAGPATNLAWWGLALGAQYAFAPTGVPGFLLASFAEINFGLLAFNLLPIFPLDGGRTFRGLLALKLHPNRASLIAANVGLVGGGALFLLGFFGGGAGGFLTALIGMTAISACLQERAVARFSDGPYAHAADPWSFDADAWRGGRNIAGEEAAAARPGFFERRRREKAAAAAVRAAERRRELEAEVDRLLDKVAQQGGLAALSRSEQDALKRASAELKRLRGG